MFPQKKDLQFWEIIVSFRENTKKVRNCIHISTLSESCVQCTHKNQSFKIPEKTKKQTLCFKYLIIMKFSLWRREGDFEKGFHSPKTAAPKAVQSNIDGLSTGIPKTSACICL